MKICIAVFLLFVSMLPTFGKENPVQGFIIVIPDGIRCNSVKTIPLESEPFLISRNKPCQEEVYTGEYKYSYEYSYTSSGNSKSGSKQRYIPIYKALEERPRKRTVSDYSTKETVRECFSARCNFRIKATSSNLGSDNYTKNQQKFIIFVDD